MGLVRAGLDGYWNSKKGLQSSTWNDLSGQGRNATILGGASRSDPAGLYFDGNGSRVQLPLPGAYLSKTQPYTIELWMRCDLTGNGGAPTLYCSPSSDSVNEIWYRTDYKDLRYAMWRTNGNSEFMAIPFEASALTHFALTFDGNSTVTAYRNGQQVQSYTSEAPVLLVSGSILTVGCSVNSNGGTSYPWKGIIDCIRVYNRHLGASEVTENFNLGMDVGISTGLQGAIQAKSRVTVEFENTAGIAAQAQSSLATTANLSIVMKLEGTTSVAMAATAMLNTANVSAGVSGASTASAGLDVAVGPGVTAVDLEAGASGELTASGYFYLAVVAATAAASSVTGFVNTDRPLTATAGGALATSAHLTRTNPFSGASVANSRATAALADSIWKKVDTSFERWRNV